MLDRGADEQEYLSSRESYIPDRWFKERVSLPKQRGNGNASLLGNADNTALTVTKVEHYWRKSFSMQVRNIFAAMCGKQVAAFFKS